MSDEMETEATPKRVMTDDQKARMKAGRERAAASRSRGRPARREAAAPLPREVPVAPVSGDPTVEELERQIAALGDGETLTRQPRGLSDATFDIPMQGRLPGWDYEYKTVRVNAEEVDPSSLVEIEQGGWRPVPRTHFPSLTPPGWRLPYIERWGQRMYMRPMRLSIEAKEEQLKHAFQVRDEKLLQAQVGDMSSEMARRSNRVEGLNINREPAPLPGRQALL
jgi:hypothetical protein